MQRQQQNSTICDQILSLQGLTNWKKLTGSKRHFTKDLTLEPVQVDAKLNTQL